MRPIFLLSFDNSPPFDASGAFSLIAVHHIPTRCQARVCCCKVMPPGDAGLQACLLKAGHGTPLPLKLCSTLRPAITWSRSSLLNESQRAKVCK